MIVLLFKLHPSISTCTFIPFKYRFFNIFRTIVPRFIIAIDTINLLNTLT